MAVGKPIRMGPVVPITSHNLLNMANVPQEVTVRFGDGTEVSLKGRTLQKWVSEQQYMIEKTYRDAQDTINEGIKSAAIDHVLSNHKRTDA